LIFFKQYYFIETMQKQLCINRLPFPQELLSIIKEFTFYDWIQYNALLQKKYITSY